MTEERRDSVDAPEGTPAETGAAQSAAPVDQTPAGAPSDKLVVSREEAQAAAPAATMLDGIEVRNAAETPAVPDFLAEQAPHAPAYRVEQPVYEAERRQEAVAFEQPAYDKPAFAAPDQMPAYAGGRPLGEAQQLAPRGGYEGQYSGAQQLPPQQPQQNYGERPRYGQPAGQPSFSEQPGREERPGFAPHQQGAFWPGTRPASPPPPPPLVPGMGGPSGPGGPNWAPVPPPPTPARRGPSSVVFVVAGLVIALVAGAVGAGVVVATDDDKPSSGISLSPADSGKQQARDPQSVAGIAQRVLPSVVTVKVSLGDGNGGSGTGFIVKDGYIITNNHVVSAGGQGGGGSTLEVEFSDGKELPATVVGVSADNDVAVIKVTGSHDLPPLELGDSDGLVVGDQVIAIGSPLGLEGSVTTGIISAKGRVVPTRSENGGDGAVITALQTDAAINPGNSGGPLVNAADGKVIGMNTAIASLGNGQESGSIGLGFAIPIKKVASVAQTLINGGTIKKTIIGISIDTQYTGDGVKVLTQADANRKPVTPGGPADKAGLKGGDVITAFDGKAMATPEDLIGAITSHNPGDKVKITFKRGNQEQTVEVTLGSS
ncbi:S1C family serine protease [Actinocorallia longicatena]|uniref:PDZ domain-containing protein n=1 Tax=Actinocorallia longicatena TaxID=111803 RepID=A0ABP6QHY1_9ACTN